MPWTLTIPELSLVVLIGPSGSGSPRSRASTSCRPRSLSSDYLPRAGLRRRERPGRDEGDAFEVLHFIAAKRLDARAAHRHRCDERAARGAQAAGRARARVPRAAGGDRARPARARLPGAQPRRAPDRDFGRTSSASSARSCGARCADLQREGFRHVHVLRTPEEVDAAYDRARSRSGTTARRHGPFDIIGDVHGCCDELRGAARRRSATQPTSDDRRVRAHPARAQGGLRRRPGRPRAAHAATCCGS